MKLSFTFLLLTFGILCNVINGSTASMTPLKPIMTSLEEKPINCSRFVKHKSCSDTFCSWCNKTCSGRPNSCFDEGNFLKNFNEFCSGCEKSCIELPDGCPSERKYFVPF